MPAARSREERDATKCRRYSEPKLRLAHWPRQPQAWPFAPRRASPPLPPTSPIKGTAAACSCQPPFHGSTSSSGCGLYFIPKEQTAHVCKTRERKCSSDLSVRRIRQPSGRAVLALQYSRRDPRLFSAAASRPAFPSTGKSVASPPSCQRDVPKSSVLVAGQYRRQASAFQFPLVLIARSRSRGG